MRTSTHPDQHYIDSNPWTDIMNLDKISELHLLSWFPSLPDATLPPTFLTEILPHSTGQIGSIKHGRSDLVPQVLEAMRGSTTIVDLDILQVDCIKH